jgi:hypothetical protein
MLMLMSDGARVVMTRCLGVMISTRSLVWREQNSFDRNKPFHLLIVAIIVGGIAAPIANWIVQNERYRVTNSASRVVASVSPNFASKLQYDSSKQATVFNEIGQAQGSTGTPDKLVSAVGAGGKNDKQLYTATLPDVASSGVTVHDNVNDVSVGFTPEFGLDNGAMQTGRVVYPLKNGEGKLIFTPKANGLKEDILLKSAPKSDTAFYQYKLTLPSYLQAKLLDDGSIGIYSGDPQLFGGITYGTDKDRTLVEKARNVAEKTYLMFKIPAPKIVQSSNKVSNAVAAFTLVGDQLSVHVRGLTKASYPLSIDPTFVLSTTADFVLGSIDDNIDLSVASQVGRATMSGGSTPSWAPNSASLTSGNYGAGLVAYNSALYMIGGGNTDTGTTNTTTTQVKYLKLNSDGSPNGAWTLTTSMGTARQGLQAYGFNGYLYAVGGDTNAAVAMKTVEYAQITAAGAVGVWSSTASMNTNRAFFAGAIYQGVLYAMGGATGTLNAGLSNTTEYARVNGDGTITAWTQSTSSGSGNLTAARDRFEGAASNGHLYITGGLNGTPAVLNTVEYAPILSDGSIGAWTATSIIPTARRDHGMGLINGHIYVYAGCSVTTVPCPAASLQGDTEYAVVNADGTVGQWQRTGDYVYNSGAAPYGSRTDPSSAFYNGFLYFVGGCNAENTSADIHCTAAGLRVGTFATNFDTPGRFDNGLVNLQTTPPFNNSAPSSAVPARMGAQVVALRGSLYYIGGCGVANCNTATSYSAIVDDAPINADGTLGTFATTSSLISTSGGANNAGRIGHQVAVYQDKVYVIGGIEKTTGNVDSFRSDIISASWSGGGLTAWAAETNSLPVAKAFGTAEVWHNWIYVVGGLSTSATVVGTIYHTSITNDVPGTWTATTAGLTNARWGHSGGLWGNWLYVVGGQSNTTGTYITAANGTEQLTITNSGDITASVVRNVTGAPLTRLMGGFVQNGFLYTFGGYTNGSTNAVRTVNWSALNAVTGVPATWSATNIATPKTCAAGTCPVPVYGLSSVRGMTTAVTTGGVFYVMGGCSATMVATSYTACATFTTTATTAEVYLTNNGGTGELNVWAGTTGLSSARADLSTVAYNGSIYAIGGCSAYTTGSCTTAMTTVESIILNSDGTMGSSWTTQSALPAARSALQAVAYNGYLYAIAGRDSSSSTGTVWIAAIANTGTLGTWVDSASNYLPSGAERRNFGVATSNGFIYVAGGLDTANAARSDVYYAKTTGAGSLAADAGCGSTWCSSTAFTTARSALSLVAYNGNLYVIAGSDNALGTLRDVQFAALAANGTVGAWNYTTDISAGQSNRTAVASNGFMYFLGDSLTDTENNYAPINANGTLGIMRDVTNDSSVSHSRGSTVYAQGNVYSLGGCGTYTSGNCNVQSTTERAGQLSLSRVGHYSKLFNTQVDTSPTQLVVNGAVAGPTSAVELKFQTASSADPVLGVAQLFRPVVFGNYYNVQALNSSGVNVGVAYNYQYIITLDDSRSGTFPDVSKSGFSQTAVTDITLYYHANPARRLRHGASFTNTGCNPVDPTQGCILDTAP